MHPQSMFLAIIRKKLEFHLKINIGMLALCLMSIFRKPKPVDPEILRSMKVYHNVGYAPNPGNLRRNQIPYVIKAEGAAKGKSNIPESPLGRGTVCSILSIVKLFFMLSIILSC